MKNLLFALVFFVVACNCTKTDNAVTTSNNITDNALPKDSNIVRDNVPACIIALIKKLKSEPVTNPASKIYQYNFSGKMVYYVPPVCCDNFSDLYNDSCKLIAHPDGGFTGRGDRKLPTFHDDKKEEKLIWEDLRK